MTTALGLPRPIRRLARRPATPLLASVTLAMGVVTALTILAVTRGVVHRELPYPESDRLVLVWRGTAEAPATRGALSPGDWLDLRERARTLSDVAAVNSYVSTLTTDDADPVQVVMGAVTGNFFETIGFRVTGGRGIRPGDDRVRSGPDDVGIVVLAHDFWRERFAEAPDVVGRSVRLGGSLHTVVGVLDPDAELLMPEGSGMTTDLEAWVPFDVGYTGQPRDGAYLRVVARMAPGTELETARAEVDAIATTLRAEHPVHEDTGLRLRLAPLHDEVVAHVRPVLAALGVAAAVVLLVSCANVATLLLVRFLQRRTDSAVRAALGAERRRIVGGLVWEAAAVCGVGSLLGLLLAGPAVRGLVRLEPDILPRASDLSLGADSVWPALGIAAAATLLAGLGPALIATVDEVATLLRGRGSTPHGLGRRIRTGLLLFQVSASVVLLYGSSTLIGSVMAIESRDLGFDRTGVLTARLSLPFGAYGRPDGWVAFYDQLRETLAGGPGVTAAGLASDLPTEGEQSLEPWTPLDAPPGEAWGARTALHRVVTPGYFEATAIDLRSGRPFDAGDGPDAVRVALVDAALAATLSESGRVVGRLIDVTQHRFEEGYSVRRITAEVVGVVDAVPHEHPAAPPPGTIYLPLAQYPLWSMSVALRGDGDATPSSTLIRESVAAIDPGLPVTAIRTLADVAAERMATTRFLLVLVGALAAVVIVLTAAGLFGLVAEAVLQQRREIAVRIALGARSAQVVRVVTYGGLVVLGAGLVPGLLATPWVGALLRDAVGYGPAVDPAALVGAVTAVAAIAVAACWLPARRASRVQPATALKGE